MNGILDRSFDCFTLKDPEHTIVYCDHYRINIIIIGKVNRYDFLKTRRFLFLNKNNYKS